MGAWAGSTRRARLPANWDQLRRAVLQRDGYRCQWPCETGLGTCGLRANQVDHRAPGDDHSLGNLWALCDYHHRTKTAAEGNAAKPKRKREPEAHPGLIDS